MQKCAACGKFLSTSGSACCTTCPCKYHKGCVALHEAGSIPSHWICPECTKKNRKRGDNSSTPVKNIYTGASGSLAPPVGSEISIGSSAQLVTPENPAIMSQTAGVTGHSDMEDMRREINEFMAELREFRIEFRNSLAGLCTRMDSFERRLELVETAQGGKEVADLQRTVIQLKSDLNDRDQDALISDIDIGHLPEEKGENVQRIITIVAAKLGVKLEERDVVFAERVGALGAQERPRRVVVRLARRHLRDELLRAARVRRTLTTADVELAGPPRRIYLNERLTRTNRQLFHQAREESTKHNWRYCWTRRGRIFVRQGDGTQIFPLRSIADIDRVFNKIIV